MSMYKQYVEEREGKQVLESTEGFAVFSVYQDYIYIEDIFVLPEYRKKGVASKFVDCIIESSKTPEIDRAITSVDLNAKNTRQSMLAILHYGFKPYTTENTMIYFIKEL